MGQDEITMSHAVLPVLYMAQAGLQNPCHQGQSARLRPRCRFFTAQAPFVRPLLVLPRCGVMVALWMRSVFTLGWSFPLGCC